MSYKAWYPLISSINEHFKNINDFWSTFLDSSFTYSPIYILHCCVFCFRISRNRLEKKRWIFILKTWFHRCAISFRKVVCSLLYKTRMYPSFELPVHDICFPWARQTIYQGAKGGNLNLQIAEEWLIWCLKNVGMIGSPYYNTRAFVAVTSSQFCL